LRALCCEPVIVKHSQSVSSANNDRNVSPSSRPEEMKALMEVRRKLEAKSGRARVLIVEDDFLIAWQIEEMLTAAGLQVVGIASTADQAVDLAGRERPALAVMDVRLPGGRDGVDAAGDLYRRFNVRSIFATANDDPNTRARAACYAPLGWLTKPYTMTSLLGAMAAAFADDRTLG
jgi:two-component system, response regulator PdtaR